MSRPLPNRDHSESILSTSLVDSVPLNTMLQKVSMEDIFNEEKSIDSNNSLPYEDWPLEKCLAEISKVVDLVVNEEKYREGHALLKQHANDSFYHTFGLAVLDTLTAI